MIGKILKTMRKEAKITQEEISKNTEFARNTISQYETGEIQPTFETIEKIADICGYDIIFKNRKNKDITLTSKNIEREEL